MNQNGIDLLRLARRGFFEAIHTKTSVSERPGCLFNVFTFYSLQQIADIQGSDYSHKYTSFTLGIPTILPMIESISWVHHGELESKRPCTVRLKYDDTHPDQKFSES